MYQHYITLIYRSFLRAKSYFLINLFGLTAGLICTLLIYLWLNDELRVDKFHEKEVFQVMEHQAYADNLLTTTSTPGILAETIKLEIPEVEYAATTTWISSHTLSIDDHNVKAKGYHVGEDFFNIFSYSLKEGDPSRILSDKFSIVISQDLAEKLFNSVDKVVGRVVEFQHEKSFTVTGIFENISSSSSYQFDFVLPFEEFKDDNEWVTNWGNNGPSTYITLRAGSNAAEVSKKIKDFIKNKNEQSNASLFLVPYANRYLFGKYTNGEQSGGRIEYVQLFSIIAVFILLIACINFMNLSTARATRRAKEVGIKKSVGAPRRSLVIQFLIESVTISSLALLLALFAVWIFLPQFNLITDKQIVLNLYDPVLIIGFTSIMLITGILAGSYPAIFLSGFNPAAVLKGLLRGSWAELYARKGLVVLQFFLSVILIVSVIVIYKQIEFVQSKNLGYEKDNLVYFPIEGKVETGLEAFLNQVRNIEGVTHASSIAHQLMGRHNNTGGVQWEGKNPDDLILFENVSVNYDMLETLQVKLAEGRLFSQDYGSDSTKIIFNEAGIRAMNMDDPVGKTIRLWNQYDLEIIGVVEDFHFQSLHDVVKPLFFILSPKNTWNVYVRIEAGKQKEALDAIRKLHSSINPGFTLDYQFQDVEYAKQYAAEQRVATLSFYFAGFAIMISCLGLFGLAAFTAERRTKEIGIRKALGSSSANIVLLLSGDFTRIVFVSICLGLPASYFLLDEWLSRFAFHIELEYLYFISAGILALVVAWLTVATQAIKASSVNPVDCLKNE